MTLAPRFLVEFLASYRMKRLRQRLKMQGNGAAGQQAAFRNLMARQEKTIFGRQHGLTATTRYEEFRTQVPLRTTAEFRGWTERMAAGEADVLWPGRCRLFAYTAGTVDGTPKMLPATGDMLVHFRRALRDALLLHMARVEHPGIFTGLQLHAGGSTALTEANGAYAGYLDAVVPLALSPWAEKNLYALPPALARMPNGPEKMAAIARTQSRADVRLVAGTPTALLELTEVMTAGTNGERAPHLRAVWPRLECCVHTGALPEFFLEELINSVGPGVSLHEVYAAAEGFFAAQDGEPGEGLRLLSDLGVFFEFLPMRDVTESSPQLQGAHCVPLEGVMTETDYALVVTTPAGLCRCLVGDGVRFVSTTPPRLVVTGRTPLRLNSFGEQVGERELTAALREICATNDWKAVNFHVAPYFVRTVPRPQGYHEWWVELRPGTVRTPTGPLIAAELDVALRQRNHDYHARRSSAACEAPVVRLVMPGTFTQWAELHPALGGFAKLAHCRNDRQIADQLAGIARFYMNTTPPFRAGGAVRQ